MKKSARIISMILVLLTVVGLFPISIFAAGDTGSNTTKSNVTVEDLPEVVKGKGGIADKTTVDKILRSGYVTEQDVILFTDFNKRTAGTNFGGLTASADKSAALYGSSDKTYMVIKTGSGSPAWKQVADGDIALSFSDGKQYKGGSDTYFDIVNMGKDQNGADKNADIPADKGFVFQMDVKRGDKFLANEALIGALERSGGGANTVKLVGVDTDGRLYPSAVKNETIGYLSKDVFTTIAVYVDPGENGVGGKYWIYINGVNVNEDGYKFSGYGSRAFRLNAMRCYQISFNADDNYVDLSTDGMMFDNLQCYYVADSFKAADYIGLDTTSKSGFVTDGKGIRLYKDGTLVPGGTHELDGFQHTFDSDGYLITKKLTSAVDLYGMLDTVASSGDYVFDLTTGRNFSSNVNNEVRLLGRNTSILRDKYTYEWLSNKSGKALYLPTTVVDWSDYDAIEFSVWTYEVEQLFTYLTLMSPSENRSFCYYGRYVSFGDKAVQAYNDKGKTATHAAGFGIKNWANMTIELASFSKAYNEATLSYIPEIRFNTASWNLDHKFQSDTTTLAINTEDVSVHFAGINLVKYERVETLDDYVTEIGGKLVPKFGQVGFKSVDDVNVYYDPTTQKIVTNQTRWVEEEQKAYVFDATGNGTLANGLCVIGGKTYCYDNGVVKTEDFTIGEKKYKVNGDGSVIGIYGETYADWTPYAEYTATEHDKATTYLTSIDFQSYKDKVYNNKGGNLTFDIKSGSTTLQTLFKNTGARMVTEANGNVYMECGNHYDSVDPFMQLNLNNVTTATVFDFDVKLGDTWNAVASLFQPISAAVGGGTREFGDALMINSQGYVYSNSDKTALLFKLDSDKFTRISLALDPAARTYSVYVNGVKVYTKNSYAGTGSKNIANLRMFHFNSRCELSSICLDNFYVYSGTEPQTVVSADLRKGSVNENGTTRLYADNGAIKLGVQGENTYHPENGMLLKPEYMNGAFNIGGMKLYRDGKIVDKVGFTEIDGKTYYVCNNDGSVYNRNNYLIGDNLYVFAIDGALKFVSAADVDTLASIEDFANGISGADIGYDANGAYVGLSGGLKNGARYLFPKTLDLSSKKYIEIDIYVPAEYNKTDMNIIYGTTGRYYGVNKKDESYSLNGKFKLEDVLSAELKANGQWLEDDSAANVKFTYDSGITIENKVRKVVGKDGATGEYYVYQKWSYQYMKNLKLDQVTPGWQTIRIELPKESLGSSYAFLRNIDFFQFNVTGWSMNVNRDWNTNGKDYVSYPDIEKCDFRISELRVGTYGTCVSYDIATNAGWSEDNTYYLDETGAKLTGVQFIDGKWYEFSADGVLKGALNGLHATEHYEKVNGKFVLKMENRVFVDGVMQVAEGEENKVVKVGDKIYITDANGLLIKNEFLKGDDGRSYYIDEAGEGAVAEGFIESKFYDDGYLASGEYTVTEGTTSTDYYFKNGEGMGAYIVKSDGMIVYGSDGKYVEKTDRPVVMTLKITKPGATETVVKFYQFVGKEFKYAPAEVSGYVAKIKINGVDADEIAISSVTADTEIVITYEAAQ